MYMSVYVVIQIKRNIRAQIYLTLYRHPSHIFIVFIRTKVGLEDMLERRQLAGSSYTIQAS